MSNPTLELAEMRRRLRESASAKGFWRSLEELMNVPEFLEALRQEFPTHLNAGTYSLLTWTRWAGSKNGSSRT